MLGKDDEKRITYFCAKLEGKYLSVDGRIILKLITKKLGARTCIYCSNYSNSEY